MDERFGFDPLGKVVRRRDHVPESSRSCWEDPDNIKPPLNERVGWWRRGECFWHASHFLTYSSADFFIFGHQ